MSAPDTDWLDDRFLWAWIEQAWRATPDGEALRAGVVDYTLIEVDLAFGPFLTTLDRWLGHLSKEGLATFGRAFERALFVLDREDFAEHLGFGDDVFLDARATVALLGEAYFCDVVKDVRGARGIAVEKASGALAAHWRRRCGEGLPRFAFDTATGSNPDGWPEARERAAGDARFAAAVEHLARELRAGGTGVRATRPGFMSIAVPNLAIGELAIVLRRVADTLTGRGG